MSDGIASNWNPVSSCVPQGSILGPHLFSLFVNDIPQGVTSNCLLVADDLMVFRGVSCVSDCHVFLIVMLCKRT